MDRDRAYGSRNSGSNKADRNKESDKADRNKESNSTGVNGTSNAVGPSRRYVSGDEEKSSSAHQFHKS